ncbi:MAG: DUF6305 family protein [Tissierellia bacterium]|nr:DUF6305 family protein [Tissierellia bacterium]
MKKLNNFIITIIVLVILMTMMTACSNSTEPTTNNTETKEPETEEFEIDETKADVTLKGPYIITTCGQSPGAVMMNMVAMQEGLTSVNDNALTAEALNTDEYKTLIVTTGTSMKGMGAAGTDVNAEIERCVKLINTAKEAGLTIVGAHIEGMARRTDSSDAASIDAVMELADVILIIEESDSDGFFTKYAEDNNKQLIMVENTLAISSVLK